MGGTCSIQNVNLNTALKKAAIRYRKRWQPFIIQLQIRIFEIIMFMDFFHRPMFFFLKKTTFRKLDLFASSGKKKVKTRIDSVSQTLCLF
jgi:hypothetical protein